LVLDGGECPSHFTSRKEPLVHIFDRLDGYQSWSGHDGKEINPPHTRNQTPKEFLNKPKTQNIVIT